MSGGLSFSSSSAEANELFAWARRQALAYAFTGDPVGPWYEAALPGREAFCMRDVSHQSEGAHVLGLGAHTRNMIRVFARAVTQGRDWCSLWEVDRHGNPPRADYLSDDEFWYCLPASFDLLDCCYRMWAWTGDRAYITDRELREFYRVTVHEYVERWELGVDRIMGRKRILNARQPLAGRLTRPRGIPGYNEENPDFRVGFDLMAALYAGYRAYAALQELQGETGEAAVFRERSAQVSDLIERVWWDGREGCYYDFVDREGNLVHGAGHAALSALHWRITDRRDRVRSLVRRVGGDAPALPPDAVEVASHVPEILYRHGDSSGAFHALERLARSRRREYPEVSFTVVGAVVSGLMGTEPRMTPPADAAVSGSYVDRVLATLPRIPDPAGWAQLEGLVVGANTVSVRHEGTRRTTLSNDSGPALIWEAAFPGSRGPIRADGAVEATVVSQDPVTGDPVCRARIVVGAGESLTAEAP